jgi:hypothetical protein
LKLQEGNKSMKNLNKLSAILLLGTVLISVPTAIAIVVEEKSSVSSASVNYGYKCSDCPNRSDSPDSFYSSTIEQSIEQSLDALIKKYGEEQVYQVFSKKLLHEQDKRNVRLGALVRKTFRELDEEINYKDSFELNPTQTSNSLDNREKGVYKISNVNQGKPAN